MANVYPIFPILHFPYRRPFQIKDGYNKARGTWWYRSKVTGLIVGPFQHEHAARLTQQTEDSANGFL